MKSQMWNGEALLHLKTVVCGPRKSNSVGDGKMERQDAG